MHLVMREVMCKPKKYGGIGVRREEVMNKAMLA